MSNEDPSPAVRPDIPYGGHWAVLLEEPLEYYVLKAGYESRNIQTTRSIYIPFESQADMETWMKANGNEQFVVLNAHRLIPVTTLE